MKPLLGSTPIPCIGPAEKDRSRIGLLSGVVALAVALCCPTSIAGAELEGDHGIAARYPRDVGIEADPAVLFVENFEEGSTERVFARWEDAAPVDRMSLRDNVPGARSGSRSLLMHKQPGDGSHGAHLYRRLLPDGANGYPQIYARMYVKIGAGSDPIHHFGANLGGNNPPTPWPAVNAGKRSRGDASFWTGVEPYAETWRWDFYTYWMEMRSWQNDDGSGSSFTGNAFLREGAAGGWASAGPEVRRGEWICVELMVKVNDPVSARNGEQALWIDGKLVRKDGQIVSHLGAGFPKGSWLRDKWSPDPRGSPFEGYRWRSSPELLVNFVWLYVYTEQDGYDIPVYFDDVVVATRYIGPLYNGERPRLDLAR